MLHEERLTAEHSLKQRHGTFGSDEQAIVGSEGADRLCEKLSETSLTAPGASAEDRMPNGAKCASAPGSFGIKTKGK